MNCNLYIEKYQLALYKQTTIRPELWVFFVKVGRR